MADGLKLGHRIVVLCEGKTEYLAVRHFVARQWEADGLASVGLDPRDLRGHLDRVGIFGCNYLDEGDALAVFALVDLQGMKRVSHPPNDELGAKVRRVQGWLRDQVGQHARARYFFPHVSVHQVEAWILAEGAALSRRLRDPSIAPDPKAEGKDFQNPPSKRISELFLRSKEKRRYQKIEDGEPLFSNMEFQPVYDSCLYFRKFYDDLKAAARQ
jgi:hypothetical protein